MQQGKEGSLLTQPSEAKPRTNPPIINHSQLFKPSPQNRGNQLHEREYSNEFLSPLQNAKSIKTPVKDRATRTNRSKTEPKQQPIKLCRKREALLPQIKGGESIGVDVVRGMERDGRLAKLRQLYEKKSKLFRKLQFVNKRLIQAKMEMAFPIEPSLPLASTLNPLPQPTNPPILPLGKAHSRSHGGSRNNQYFLDFRRTKHPSPESISSIDKNRQVISFIQKMHEQSVKRDLNRYERNQKLVASQLSDVCLECSRSKCQADALGRILKESRFRT